MKIKTWILSILLTCGYLYGGVTGKVVGVITDEKTGNPLIGCNIILQGTSLGAATDLDGAYIILNIPPGTYTVKTLMIGYASSNITNVIVRSDLTTTIDVSMKEETIEGEEVTVVAKRPLITKDLTASTAIVDGDMIDQLPVTEISEILELQAGFVQGHLRGGRSGEVAYWIDGVPMTDVFDGGTIVDVNKNTVSEMQVISGAFNAEYGQAMSGIVNIVTKDGSDNFKGSATLYGGDFLTGKSGLFLNANKFNPMTTNNIDINIEGPIIPEKLFFNLTGRTIYYQGIHEGQRRFNPHNVSYRDNTDEFQLYRFNIENGDTLYPGKGDNAYVPMNWNKKLYLQGKLIYKFSPFTKLKYALINDDVTYQDYDRMYRYNPDGNLTRFRLGKTHLLNLNHSFSGKTFVSVGFTRFNKSYNHQTYAKDQWDKYVHPKLLNTQPYSFLTGGTNPSVFSRQTSTTTLKIDLTSQMNKQHQVKTGIDFRFHQLSYVDYSLRPPDEKASFNELIDDPFLINPQRLPDSTIYSSSYQFNPFEAGAYLQDKIEFNELIINVGFRVDYFNPKGEILSDPTDPSINNPIRPENIYTDLNENGVRDVGEPSVTLSDRKAYWFKQTSPKWKISPRFGASFPFSTTGVVHFSYGHFFQVPRFQLLYMNPDFDLGQGTGNIGVIGNSDLRPEKTVQGELGIQLSITSNIVMDLTAYFRDIRDLTGTRSKEIDLFGGSASYNKLVNSDFAYVRGVIMSISMRETNGLSGNLDYTFQIAKGSASDPQQARNAIAGGSLPEIQLIPLNWDQRHTVNLSAAYNRKNWGMSAIAQIGSGLPYTPLSTEDISSLVQNSGKKPITWNVDFKGFYTPFKNATLFIRVENVFDYLNQHGVYDDSGKADFTRWENIAKSQNTDEAVNTIHSWFNNETFYSMPRRIEFGVTYGF
jgi:outer membrane receptor protein involved in Fe transport